MNNRTCCLVLMLCLAALPQWAGAWSMVTISAAYQNQLVHYDTDGDAIADGLHMTDGGAGDDPRAGGHGRINIGAQRLLDSGLTAFAGVNSAIGANGAEAAATGFATREVFLGLRGGFGLLRAGRLETPYATAGRDPLNATFLQGRGNGGRLGLADGLGNGGYRDAVVRYDRRLGGYAVAAALLLDEPSGGDESHGVSLRLEAPAGPGSLWLAATAADGHGGQDATHRGGTLFKLGGSLDAGPARTVLEYERYTAEPAGTESYGDREHLFASVRVPLVGAHTLVLNGGTETEAGSDYTAVAWLYDLGERTRLHTGVRRTDTTTTTTALGAGLRLAF